jgi:hypothetical protein
VNGIFIPGSPAEPRNSAYSDHRNALTTPSEISVSIVAAPCRRFVQAALWNGHAAHVTTGNASVSDAHCHDSNCKAGIIPNAITGTASTMLAISRSRRGFSSSGSSADGSTAGVGRLAVYPVFSTAATRSSVEMPSA